MLECLVESQVHAASRDGGYARWRESFLGGSESRLGEHTQQIFKTKE